MNETNESIQFFDDLMGYIMEGVMIPKVQIERNIGPIIGFFLEDVLSEKFGKKIITLCPEFPILKSRFKETGNKKSTNIDWLMYNLEDKEIIFLELKTADTSFNRKQVEFYLELEQLVSNMKSAIFLLDDLDAILRVSSEKGKYGKLKSNFNKSFENKKAILHEELSNCERAQVVYLLPKVSQVKAEELALQDEGMANIKWLSFAELPSTLENHRYSAQWSILYKHLVELDPRSRSYRNKDYENKKAQRYYAGEMRLDALVAYCLTSKEPIVIGFTNWRKRIDLLTLDDLNGMRFKWDYAKNGMNNKIERNWIAGGDFLRYVDSLSAPALV